MANEVDYIPTKFVVQDNLLPRIGDTLPYRFNNKVKIAVDIALTINRPLLVAGVPGSGKSRLAEAMAAVLGWNYLNYTVTSRTRLEDLTADFDHLQRLSDANAKEGTGIKPDWAYYKPGLFWWAFDKESAIRRGGSQEESKDLKVMLSYPGKSNLRNENKTVLLIDEIDKAEPDLPNDLLEALDRRRFFDPKGELINAKPGLELLTIITTNGERELPGAFVRRCVTLYLDEPKQPELEKIAHDHFSHQEFELDKESFEEIVSTLAKKIISLRAVTEKQDRRPASTGEFLDAVRATAELKKGLDDQVWKRVEQSIEQSILSKNLAGS